MSYNIKCLKCSKPFVSEDEADFDGEAFCPQCVEEKKIIAARVDEQIAQRRANRQPRNSPNIYQEARAKRKGSTTWMNI